MREHKWSLTPWDITKIAGIGLLSGMTGGIPGLLMLGGYAAVDIYCREHKDLNKQDLAKQMVMIRNLYK